MYPGTVLGRGPFKFRQQSFVGLTSLQIWRLVSTRPWTLHDIRLFFVSSCMLRDGTLRLLAKLCRMPPGYPGTYDNGL